jgi:hypothetical protein
MKNKYNLIVMSVFVIFTLLVGTTKAQWVYDGPFLDRWTHTENLNPQNSIRRVGIGDFSTTLGPRAAMNIDANLLLQLEPTAGNYFLPGEVFRTDGPDENINAWRLWTGGGAQATEKFALYVPGSSENVFLRASATASRMFFYTGGVNIGNQRMIVSQAPGTNNPRVGIGNYLLSEPETYLHIGTDISPNSGFRTWMNIGTLYNNNSDNMYVGLRQLGTDRHDAIINWGNNPTTQPQLVDRLRFVFTAYTNVGVFASGTEGLEIARMISDGNNGYMGIGDFLTAGFEPMHRLTIMHDTLPVLGIINDKPLNDPNNMKLELALAMGNGYFSNVAVAGDGVLRANGNATRNMIISARNFNDGNIRFTTGNAATEAERMRVSFNGNVGIGDFITLGQDPTHRLDVIGNARIRELPEPQWQSNITKYVVVDNSGVLYWNDTPPGGGTLGNECGATQNPLTVNWEIPMNNRNFIFSGQGTGNYRVGIGLNPSTGGCYPDAKLDVLQNHDQFAIKSFINSGHSGARAIQGTSHYASLQVGVEGIVESGVRQIGVSGIALYPEDGSNTGCKVVQKMGFLILVLRVLPKAFCQKEQKAMVVFSMFLQAMTVILLTALMRFMVQHTVLLIFHMVVSLFLIIRMEISPVV